MSLKSRVSRLEKIITADWGKSPLDDDFSKPKDDEDFTGNVFERGDKIMSLIEKSPDWKRILKKILDDGALRCGADGPWYDLDSHGNWTHEGEKAQDGAVWQNFADYVYNWEMDKNVKNINQDFVNKIMKRWNADPDFPGSMG